MAIEVVALTEEENRVLEVEIEGGIKMDGRMHFFRGKQKTEDGVYMEI